MDRLDQNQDQALMARQASIPLTYPDNGVIVVGCGGVGSWTAYFLGLAGVKKLWLFDPDILAIHNLNRIPLPPSEVGKFKSQALADLLLQVRPDISAIPLLTFHPLAADQVGCAAADWLVCTTDTLASRTMAYDWAISHGVKYIEAAAEGDQGSAAGSPAEWATEAETQPGYASVPVWIGPSVAAAYFAVSHVLHGTELGDRCLRMGFGQAESSGSGEKEFQIFDSTAIEVEEEVEEIEA